MDNKYEERLYKIADELDNILCNDEKIKKLCNDFIENNTSSSIIGIFDELNNVIQQKEDNRNVLLLLKDLKDTIYLLFGYREIRSIVSNKQIINDSYNVDTQYLTLDELLSMLNSLVGLQNVKKEVENLICYQKVQKMRQKYGLSHSNKTMHMAFMGNPGTGKTTVARIVGRIYKTLGILSQGHFIEASRTDLIAGYQGQTALKVKEVIKRAKGGVLFIDEAYSITENDNSDAYGKECLTELTKALEDYRDDLVVIVAGYTEPMKHFFESNPGLKSRFNTFIEFNDYNLEELKEILISMCKKNDYLIDDIAMNKICDNLSKMISQKNKDFPNGRLMRNIYEKLTINHARRVVEITNPNELTLKKIIVDDVTNDVFKQDFY